MMMMMMSVHSENKNGVPMRDSARYPNSGYRTADANSRYEREKEKKRMRVRRCQ
jgi:hypothetical protein